MTKAALAHALTKGQITKDEFNEAVFSKLNAERERQGLPPVERDVFFKSEHKGPILKRRTKIQENNTIRKTTPKLIVEAIGRAPNGMSANEVGSAVQRSDVDQYLRALIRDGVLKRHLAPKKGTRRKVYVYSLSSLAE